MKTSSLTWKTFQPTAWRRGPSTAASCEIDQLVKEGLQSTSYLRRSTTRRCFPTTAPGSSITCPRRWRVPSNTDVNMMQAGMMLLDSYEESDRRWRLLNPKTRFSTNCIKPNLLFNSFKCYPIGQLNTKTCRFIRQDDAFMTGLLG